MSRILFVNHTSVLGGAELSLLDIAIHYRESCRVLLFEDGPLRQRLEDRGVPVTVLQNRPSLRAVSRSSGLAGDLWAIPTVLQLAWQTGKIARDYDLLYANTQKSMLVGTLAASILGKPFVWHLRDLMSKAHFNRVHRCLAIGAANVSTTSVIANSFATKQAFVESGGRESKVTVIYNGIESEPFNGSDSASSRRIREQLGLQDASIVGAFSRLAPWKGQHTLIQALETIPNAHVLLVGDALFESDRSYVEHLHALTKNLQMQDRVHFLGFREDIADVMQACDIVAHTSVSPEPFGRVIVEGMLSARPVIATNAGGAAEIIQDGETGLLVAPGESLTLANAIREILEDPSKSEKLSRNGRQYALRRFTLDTMLSGITKHLEQLF